MHARMSQIVTLRSAQVDVLTEKLGSIKLRT